MLSIILRVGQVLFSIGLVEAMLRVHILALMCPPLFTIIYDCYFNAFIELFPYIRMRLFFSPTIEINKCFLL